MVDYIIDSYAWVEYFLGSKKGEVLRKLFSDGKNNFFIVECCLAEINGWAIKNKLNFEEHYKIIETNSEILELNEEAWIKAAEEKAEQRKTEKNFGLIDAVILVKQKELKCKIVSGDKHFKKLKNVLFLND